MLPPYATLTSENPVCVDGTPSSLPPELINAYLNTWYEVALPARAVVCTLQIGVPSPVLLNTMQQQGVRQASLITPCNPRSEVLSPVDNERRMQQLRDDLLQEGWRWTAAFGRDPISQWPGEDSLLVWHMTAVQASEWGQRWQQNAVLHIDGNAVPHLLLLR